MYRKTTHDPLSGLEPQEDEQDETDELYAKALAELDKLPWYDRLLFKTFVDGDHTVSSLARATGIPRTSVSLTINRVRKHLKKSLR